MKHLNRSKWHVMALAAVFVLLVLCCVQNVKSQTSETTVKVISSQPTAQIGETIIVNITISDVENLYGLDVTLEWNNAVLQILKNESFLGTELFPNGVLHNPLFIVEDASLQDTGTYHLVATSQNPADSFNGSGTIVSLTFNVIGIGVSDFTLRSELADHPLPEATSEIIVHTAVSGSVEVLSSSATSLLSPSPSLSPSPTIPEFPAVAILVVAVIVTLVLVLACGKMKKSIFSKA